MKMNATLALTTVTLKLFVQILKGHFNAFVNLAIVEMESVVPVNNFTESM